MIKDSLGDRMKKYEYVTRTHLTPRTPVIIRLDGKSFHTFIRGFEKPFDEIFSQSMQETMLYLCENIQGCVLGYTQSDEITLVLVDYKELGSQGWFDYNIQKCVSVAASMATLAFNHSFSKLNLEYFMSCDEKSFNHSEAYVKATVAGAMFDARIFNIPKEEVTNCILWRQNDASRNSVQMVGFANFSQKEMQDKSCSEVQDMLMLQKGINWNDFPTKFKRGSCCVRKQVEGSDRPHWVIDNEIPIFKSEGRDYFERLIKPNEPKNNAEDSIGKI